MTSPVRSVVRCALAAASMAVLLDAQPVGAQATGPRVFGNPPLLELRREPAPVPRARAPAGAPAAVSREARLDLDVVYTDGTLYNPATGRADKVRLRSYRGTQIDPAAPFVSPMLEVDPGDTIRVTLNNKLPPDPSCAAPRDGPNTPHCFNGTNLHTHGLWVNPAGNGDNVLISIDPGVSFQYEYNIPADHPAGTYWFHTHRHGSTALQVASGMAGALIIRGRRLPTPGGSGDIDTLLVPTGRQPFRQRVVVLQQIQYACRDAQGKIKYVDAKNERGYRCDPGDVGGIESYDQFGPGSWPASGRYTSINGRVLPTFGGAAAGQIERWRVIHGGVRDSVNLEFRRLGSGAETAPSATAGQQDAFIGDNCTGEALPQHAIAADGLTTAAAVAREQTVFQPGYRWDLLMVFPREGRYCVIDAAAPESASVDRTAPSRRLLGFVDVARGRPVPSDLTGYLTRELVAAAAVNMPASVRGKVVTDLRRGLALSSFVPHPDVKKDEVTGTQQVVFNIDVNSKPTRFEVNGHPFDADNPRLIRHLVLGGVDEWTLQSHFVSHPFHIHVNPFQIDRILDPDGKDVSGPDAVDDYVYPRGDGEPPAPAVTVDPQYRGLKGVWKDTLWVKNAAPPGKKGGEYTLVVRSRYRRYIGDYVLHCHILDHEDQGMMQIVRVGLPGGDGGAGPAHRH